MSSQWEAYLMMLQIDAAISAAERGIEKATRSTRQARACLNKLLQDRPLTGETRNENLEDEGGDPIMGEEEDGELPF